MVSKKFTSALKGLIAASLITASFTSTADSEASYVSKVKAPIELEIMKWLSLDGLIDGEKEEQQPMKCNPYPRCKINPTDGTSSVSDSLKKAN